MFQRINALLVVVLTIAPFSLVAQQATPSAKPATTDGAPPTTVLPTGNAAIDKYNLQYILLSRSLLSPLSVHDAYGHRIGANFIAMQIVVANRNADFDFLLTDAAIDLARLVDHLEGTPACKARSVSLRETLAKTAAYNANSTVTGIDLTTLRGVAEKGRTHDPRNLTINILSLVGTTAAAFVPLGTAGDAVIKGVSAYNGPFLTALRLAFPDLTSEQLNRLNDSAWTPNTVVGKQHAKSQIVFIPVSYLLNPAEIAEFTKHQKLNMDDNCMDLRLLDASADGHFVTKIDLTSVITGVTINPDEAKKFAGDNFVVSGTLLGRFLTDAALTVENGPEGLTVARTGGDDASILFQLKSTKPLAPGQTFNLLLKKAGTDDRRTTVSVSYTPAKPTIDTGGLSPNSLAAGSNATFTITGTGFLPGAKIEVTPATGITLGDVTFVDTKHVKVQITVAAGSATGARTLQVRTIDVSGPATLTIN